LKKLSYIFVVAFIFCIYSGCSSDTKDEIVLARVAGNKLIGSEVPFHVDTASEQSKGKLNDFINHWINISILYEEAKGSHITSSNDYKMMVEQAKRDIAVNMLLQEEIYNKEISISSAEIINYYNRHKNEYLLTTDVVNISYALFINESAAMKFSQTISEKNKWIAEIENFISSHAQELVSVYEDSLFFKRSELYPPDVWKTASALNINEISKPVRTFDGYMVVKLNSYQKAGEIGNLNYAREDIIERLTMDKKKELYMKYLNTLYSKYRTEKYFDISSSNE